MPGESGTAAAALIRAAADRLAAAGVPSPRADAELLAAHVAGVPRSRLATAVLTPAQAERLAALVARRAARVPLQHLTGRAPFRYLDLAVGPGVFVPRPETEDVAGAAVALARAAGPTPVVVDLCAGSGAVALAVAHEVPGAAVHAVERAPAALTWLRRNAGERAAAGDAPVTVVAADVADVPTALPGLVGAVDVVVANPPYLSAAEVDGLEPEVRVHDPYDALVAPDDGLATVRTVAAAAFRLLRPGGWLVVEHGDGQRDSVPAILRAAGFADVADHDDLAGRPRYAKGRRP